MNYGRGFIEGKIASNLIQLLGGRLRIDSFIPLQEIQITAKQPYGVEGQELNMVGLITQSVETDRQVVLIHQTSPFYVEEPDRKKPVIRFHRIIQMEKSRKY